MNHASVSRHRGVSVQSGCQETAVPRKEESPVAITRKKKEELVARYRELLEESTALVFTDYRGVTVAQINDLRNQLKETGTTYMVVKNRLLKLALEQSGRSLDLDGLLTGPNAVAFLGEDIGKGVKTLRDWIKQNGEDLVTIKGALLEDEVLDAKRAASLANLPTREEMLATLLATIMAPASQLVRVIHEPGASLARVIKARADQEQQAA